LARRRSAITSALCFFFRTTLGRPEVVSRLPTLPMPERLPVVLSPDEVFRLINHARGLKYRAALSIAYGCGLRISEIAHLKVAGIDSERMLIASQPRMEAAGTASRPMAGPEGVHSASRRTLPIIKSP
jgi:integrase